MKSHLRTSKNQKGTEKVKIPTPASERCHAWRATDLIPKMLISGSIRNMNGSISDINGNFPDFANKQQKFSVSTRSVQYIQYFQFFFSRFDTLNRGQFTLAAIKKINRFTSFLWENVTWSPGFYFLFFVF